MKLAEKGINYQWISVEDRLPKDQETMLVYTDGAYNCKAWYYEEEDEWRSSCNDEFTVDDEVTHWMPLPEPPKE